MIVLPNYPSALDELNETITQLLDGEDIVWEHENRYDPVVFNERVPAWAWLQCRDQCARVPWLLLARCQDDYRHVPGPLELYFLHNSSYAWESAVDEAAGLERDPVRSIHLEQTLSVIKALQRATLNNPLEGLETRLVRFLRQGGTPAEVEAVRSDVSTLAEYIPQDILRQVRTKLAELQR